MRTLHVEPLQSTVLVYHIRHLVGRLHALKPEHPFRAEGCSTTAARSAHASRCTRRCASSWEVPDARLCQKALSSCLSGGIGASDVCCPPAVLPASSPREKHPRLLPAGVTDRLSPSPRVAAGRLGAVADGGAACSAAAASSALSVRRKDCSASAGSGRLPASIAETRGENSAAVGSVIRVGGIRAGGGWPTKLRRSGCAISGSAISGSAMPGSAMSSVSAMRVSAMRVSGCPMGLETCAWESQPNGMYTGWVGSVMGGCKGGGEGAMVEGSVAER